MIRRIRYLDQQLVELMQDALPSRSQLDKLIAKSEYLNEGRK